MHYPIRLLREHGNLTQTTSARCSKEKPTVIDGDNCLRDIQHVSERSCHLRETADDAF